MKRWKIPALFVLSIGTLLITCFALFLHRGTEERKEDLPIHPISGTSYSNSSKKHLNTVSKTHLNHNHENIDETTHRHNYRRRFSDAIKGVFTDVFGKNGTDESKENNSSRLKRQLEVGTESDEDANDDDYEIIRTTSEDLTSSQPTTTASTTTRKIFTTRRPFMKILKFKNAKKPVLISGPPETSNSHIPRPKYSDEVSDSPGIATSRFATSSEEGQGEKSERNENQSRRRNSIRKRFRVPVRSNGNYPSTRFDPEDEDSDFPENPKNFTLEVVEVKRKVIRKEDGNIPPSLAKGHYDIGPKIMNAKADLEDRPAVSYKKKNRNSKEKRIPQEPTNRRSFTVESSKESNSAPIKSAESSIEERRKFRSREGTSLELDNENHARENTTSSEKSVVVDLNKQVPHDDRDLTDEDLKDYNDGHSTFGSKGNFQHTIISRNVSGFLPNEQEEDGDSHEGLRKRSGNNSGRKIVIEKGRVTESYPEVSGEIENVEIYAVPGGRRISSREEETPNTEENDARVESKRVKGRKDNNSEERGDLTSPAIQTSLDELYRKGHPGVVPAPNPPNYKSHPLSEPYGESDYGSPFKYNPLEDEPPLKFDPASDRYYGSPVPDSKDSKEKLGQSNSLVPIENRNGNDQDLELQEEFYQQPAPPTKKKNRIQNPIQLDVESASENSEDAEGVTEETEENEQSPEKNQRRVPNNDGFQYGRIYNPPDTDYDYGNIDSLDGTNDRSDSDFEEALEANYQPQNEDDDFFEFPGEDGGTVREVRKKFNSRPDNEAVRIDDNDYVEPKRPKRPKLPSQSRKENVPDYEGEREFGFAPFPQGGTRRNGKVDDEDAPHDVYDSGFIQTLKQFDEEIKKLQEQERRKLLQSHPIPEQIQRTPIQPEKPKPVKGLGVNQELGYKKQGPPLVISSPGPLEEPPYESPNTPPRDDEEESSDNEEPEIVRGVTDSNNNNEQQEEPPTIRGKEKPLQEEDEVGEEIEDAPVPALKARIDQEEETEEESVPISVRSMEEVITSFQPLFKKRSTDGLKENIEVIK